MALSVPPKTDTPTVTCTIDGVEVTVPSGTTIYTAAQQAGIEIPVLCHDERYDPSASAACASSMSAGACSRPRACARARTAWRSTTAEREGRKATGGARPSC